MNEQEILDANLASVFGPAATHSEYTRGATVHYMYGGEERTGEIVWISAPTRVEGQHVPLLYHIVDPHYQFPDPTSSGEILEPPFPCD